MAVEVFGVVFGDVERRLKPFVFDASSNPTSTEVGTVITEVAGDVNGHIEALGFDPAGITVASNPRSYQILARLIADGAAAEVYRALSARDPSRSKQLDAQYNKQLDRILRTPQMLGDAFSRTSNPGGYRSHVDDTQLDLPKDDDGGAQPRFRVGDGNRAGRTWF